MRTRRGNHVCTVNQRSNLFFGLKNTAVRVLDMGESEGDVKDEREWNDEEIVVCESSLIIILRNYRTCSFKTDSISTVFTIMREM